MSHTRLRGGGLTSPPPPTLATVGHKMMRGRHKSNGWMFVKGGLHSLLKGGWSFKGEWSINW